MDLIARGMATTRPAGISSVTVLVDVDHVADGHGATFEDDTPIPASAYQQHTCEAVVYTLHGHRHHGQFIALDCQRQKRRATAEQWRALVARDHGCLRCGPHPRHTQAHHIISWAQGGKTDLSNLTLLCAGCHADCHAGLFTITMINNLPHITETWPGKPPP